LLGVVAERTCGGLPVSLVSYFVTCAYGEHLFRRATRRERTNLAERKLAEVAALAALGK